MLALIQKCITTMIGSNTDGPRLEAWAEQVEAPDGEPRDPSRE